ncbi:PstS family phosphate ABC transporter substrate-binding protein [Glaciecola sp. 2405UD65-10]|uniref:PstS family phosphate ABC transporter substrate-binding protein n=1 Tax=Glaciecola sp. 2405UD65-10 TaxID=3397244 RepID=UPI003B5C0612
MTGMIKRIILSIVFALIAAPLHAQTPRIDIPLSASIVNPNDYDYRSVPGVHGTLTSVGSETLAGLMTIWAQRFQELYPHVKFQIQASGSSTALPALIQGTSNIGPMSRKPNTREIAQFSRVYGYSPTTMIVAIDAVALYVENNNPLTRLTLAEVDSLFSATRLCGGAKNLTSWQDLGVNAYGEARTIQLFGRNSASGTYDLFKSQALCNGDYLRSVNEMPSSSSVVQSVASSVGAIGYAALGHQSMNVRTLALSANGVNYINATANNVRTGAYPFTRFLYIIVNQSPESPLSVLEHTFLMFVMSQEGQKIVADSGYFTVSERSIKKQKEQLLSVF